MKRIGILTGILLSIISLRAADSGNFEFTHNRFSFSGMLTSSDTYHLEASYHDMFNRYIGAGGAIGYWKVYYEDGWAAGQNWEIESDDNKPSNFYLHPSIILKSPALKIKSVDVGLYAEPGIMLNIPYQAVTIRQSTQWPDYDYKHISTNNGQWFAADLRAGIYANIGPCGFSAGYVMSNLDVYSQYRSLAYNGISFSKFYPEKRFMHGAYLTLSYYF